MSTLIRLTVKEGLLGPVPVVVRSNVPCEAGKGKAWDRGRWHDCIVAYGL